MKWNGKKRRRKTPSRFVKRIEFSEEREPKLTFNYSKFNTNFSSFPFHSWTFILILSLLQVAANHNVKYVHSLARSLVKWPSKVSQNIAMVTEAEIIYVESQVYKTYEWKSRRKTFSDDRKREKVESEKSYSRDIQHYLVFCLRIFKWFSGILFERNEKYGKMFQTNEKICKRVCMIGCMCAHV